MILKVIVDNNTYIDQYYYGEPAVSYYIEDEDTRLLFDVGYSQLFLKNMMALGVDVDRVNTIVISHGHDDHTKGLEHLLNNNQKAGFSIVSHPDAFKEKVFDGLIIGSPILEGELKKKCQLTLSKKPVKVSEHITFLGEIPQINNFERRKPIGKKREGNELVDDFLLDDSALVYEGDKGIYIITGCSHSGICNIVEYAKKICKSNHVIGIIGGFHLFKPSKEVDKTIEYLKDNNVRELYPCHCTSFSVRATMNNVLPVKEVGVGLTINWN